MVTPLFLLTFCQCHSISSLCAKFGKDPSRENCWHKSPLLLDQPIRYWLTSLHDDVIKWKHLPRYWPFVRGIHRSTVTGEFPAQMPAMRSFEVFFDLRLNKRLSKQWRDWLFETQSRPLWRHCIDPTSTMCNLLEYHNNHYKFWHTAAPYNTNYFLQNTQPHSRMVSSKSWIYFLSIFDTAEI